MKNLFTNVLMLLLICSSNLFAYTAEIGYGTSTVWGVVNDKPTFTQGSGATESLTSCTTGSIKSATVCNMSNTLHYEIGSNSYYLEGALTSNSESSSITEIILGGSTNSTTAGKLGAVVYSDKQPFDESSVIGVETFTLATTSDSWTTYTMSSIPSGTKSFRLYRKVSYDSSTGVIGSGTAYGSGTTIRIAYAAYTVKALGPNVSLTSGSAVDTVMSTTDMTPVVYGWAFAPSGNPTLNWSTSAPAGISAIVNPADSTITISGTAGTVTDTTTYEYSVEMVDVDTLYGSVTLLPYITPTPVISAITAQNQSVKAGAAIVSIQYEIKNAQSVNVTGLPTDVTSSYANDTLTISGTVNSSVTPADYKYIVEPTALVGYTGEAVADSGVITVLDANATTVYYITSDDAATQANDMLLQGLISNGVDVTVAAPLATTRDASYYDPYDLIVLHESITGSNATAGEVSALLTVDKPILNTKSYFYKSDRWPIGTGSNGAGEDSVAVKQTAAAHDIFKGLGDTITLVTGTTSADTKVVQGASDITVGYTLATLPGTDAVTAIHEMTPVQRGLDASSTSKYLMIALFNEMFDQISTDGVTLFTNAITYLLDPTATFTPAANTEAMIKTFAIGDSVGVIDEVAKTIAVTVANGTAVDNLDVTLTMSEGATLTAPVSTTAVDFTNSVTFTVQAEDATVSPISYAVTVKVSTATGLSEAEVSGLVSTQAGGIIINDAVGLQVSVTSVSGLAVYNDKIASTEELINVPQGIYVVSVDGVAVKVLVK